MKAIIEEFTENLKKELTFFFDTLPSLEEMEAFTMTRLRKLALDLMAGYAEEMDRALYEDRAGRRKEGLCIERRKDARSIQTISGELSYERNYYRLKDGTYCSLWTETSLMRSARFPIGDSSMIVCGSTMVKVEPSP